MAHLNEVSVVDETKHNVRICSNRIATSPSDYDGRAVIGLFVFLDDKTEITENIKTVHDRLHVRLYLEDFYIPYEDFKINTHTGAINFNKESCTKFFEMLEQGDSCLRVNSTSIHNRGGEKKTRKNKTRKNKTRKNKTRKNKTRKNKTRKTKDTTIKLPKNRKWGGGNTKKLIEE